MACEAQYTFMTCQSRFEALFHDYDYEDVMYLLIWDKLPSSCQKDEMRATMMNASLPPKIVVDIITAFQ